MNCAILIIGSNENSLCRDFDTERIIKLLSYKGYAIELVLSAFSKLDIKNANNYLKTVADAIIVCGNVNLFYDFLSNDYAMVKNAKTLEIESKIYAFMPKFEESFITDELIPVLNSKCKTFYATSIFKTFGKTEEELKEILKPYLKNKNRIIFSFLPDIFECEVQVKYSYKTSKPVVDAILQAVAMLLNDCTYAHSDISLTAQVAQTLKDSGKKLCIAESFTGGAIAAGLVEIPGISEFFKEGMVAYSNESKIRRLSVESDVIETYGAVSIETVYEMAANILIDSSCDVSVATTGNAGPTSEKEDENGVCFFAIGNKNGIHIYKYNLSGDREYVIKCGVKCALFHLYKNLCESEFKQMLTAHENVGQ